LSFSHNLASQVGRSD